MKNDYGYEVIDEGKFRELIKNNPDLVLDDESRKKKLFDEKLIADMQIFFIILSAFALFLVFLYGNEHFLGKYINSIFDFLFGYLRYLLPILLTLYGMFKYLHVFEANKTFYLILVLIQGSCNLITSTLDLGHKEGGLIGISVYCFFSLLLNDAVILLLAYTVLLFSFYQIAKILFNGEKLEIRIINMRNSIKEQKKRLKLNSEARKIQEVFSVFQINAEVINTIKGTSMDRHYIKLCGITKLSQIKKAENEIKLSLGVEAISIGTEKNNVYIEIPNGKKETLYFSKILKSKEFKAADNLSIPIGANIKGEIVYGNILEYPHALIGGATQTGKSVFLNTFIISLLKKNTPDELKIVLIDPKVMELILFKGLPHLIDGIITKPNEVETMLNYLVEEMIRRNELFGSLSCRSLKRYNEKADQKLPYIIVVIDELADLMLNKEIDVETPISRLAQMSRASGIHLIIATQRPEADIVTGLIKSNILTRISFKVSNGSDSRIILDRTGAEDLVNAGDMLYFPNGNMNPEWLKGFFMDEREVEEIVCKLVKEYENQKIETVSELPKEPNFVFLEEPENDFDKIPLIKEYEQEEIDIKNNVISIDRAYETFVIEKKKAKYFEDELTEQILLMAIESEKISIPLVREWAKKFSSKNKGIGADRATRIINELADKGFISPEKTNSPREILISFDEYSSSKNNIV